MSPKETGPAGNPYIDSLSHGLEQAGVSVDNFNRRRLLSKYQIIHVHWPWSLIRWQSETRWKSTPQAVLDIIKVTALLSVARRRGARLVWTAHDLGPHEVRRPFLYQVYQRMFTRRVDDVISLSEAAIPLLRRAYPGLKHKQIHVVEHGHYRDVYEKSTETVEESRRALGVPENQQLMVVFGQLRPYKGIDDMIRMFAAAQLSDVHLHIAGESKDGEHTALLQRLVSETPNTSLDVARVPASEVPRLLNAASAVMAPYAEGSSLNSGAALLALSFNRPVVVRDTPVMRELRDAFGSRWIHLARNGAESAAITSALSAFSRMYEARPNLDRLNWDEIVLKTVAVYRDRTARIVVLREREESLK